MISAPAVPITNIRPLTRSSRAIIRVVCYYGMFKYPVKAVEIKKNLSVKISDQELNEELELLVDQKLLSRRGRFFWIGTDEELVVRRLQGNLRARKFMRKARAIGSRVSKFPFVKGIYISGSLSKGYIDDEGDIDYFVITSPNRLWLTKGLLALIKKVFLLNSKKYFCFNYFIDDRSLKIPDENLFTAVELTTLIPIYNSGLYHEMVKKNPWALELMPNFKPEGATLSSTVKEPKTKIIWEKRLGGVVGNSLELLSMKTYEGFWRLKYGRGLKNKADVRIRCEKNVSKVHPNNFQVKVLARLEEEYAKFEQKYKLSITD